MRGVLDVSYQRQISRHFSGHEATGGLPECGKKMSHLHSVDFRLGREAWSFSRQFENKLAVDAAPIHLCGDIAENNLPFLEAELGIYICGVNRTEAQASGLQSTHSINGGRRRINNCFEVYIGEFAGDVVSFKQHRAWSIRRQKV